MSASKSNERVTADCIYERLRSGVTRIGSAGEANSHIFFVFGASVRLKY